MKYKILIVEDCEPAQFLIKEITQRTISNSEIYLASSLEEALPKVSWADLVITDFKYPSEGFLGLLPTLQKEKRPFILQSGSIKNVTFFDKTLQIAAIHKGDNDFCNILKTSLLQIAQENSK